MSIHSQAEVQRCLAVASARCGEWMLQTVHLRLDPTHEQQQALLELVHTYNAACTFIVERARAARTTNIFALQQMTADALREQFRLPAPLALRAIFTACAAAEHHRRGKSPFPPEGPLVFDERIAAFQGLQRVVLLTLAGRIAVPFFIRGARRARKGAGPGEARLIYRHGYFTLAVTLDATPAEAQAPEDQ